MKLYAEHCQFTAYPMRAGKGSGCCLTWQPDKSTAPIVVREHGARTYFANRLMAIAQIKQQLQDRAR
jgi:hypothetical protein